MVQGPWIVPISGTSVANIDEGCGQSGKVGLRQVIRVIAEPAIRKLQPWLRDEGGSPCPLLAFSLRDPDFHHGVLGPKFAVALPTSSEMSSTFLANSAANHNTFKQLQAKLGWRSERVQLDKLNIEAKKKDQWRCGQVCTDRQALPLGGNSFQERLLSY